MSGKYSLADVILDQDPEINEDGKRYNRMTNIAESWLSFSIDEFIEQKREDGVIFCVIEESDAVESFEEMTGIKPIRKKFVTECMDWLGFNLVKTFNVIIGDIEYYWVMEKKYFVSSTSGIRRGIKTMKFVDE